MSVEMANLTFVGPQCVSEVYFPLDACRTEMQVYADSIDDVGTFSLADVGTYGLLDTYIDRDHTVLVYGHIE